MSELKTVELRGSAARMVREARACIPEISTSDLMAQLVDPRLVVVDIRDIRERRREGYIPGSVHAPRGMLEFWVDPESPYFRQVFAAEEKSFVFYCASGWRSALAVRTLREMGFDGAHLRDGFRDWVASGGPVARTEDGF